MAALAAPSAAAGDSMPLPTILKSQLAAQSAT